MAIDVVPQTNNTTDVGSPTKYIDKVYTTRIVFGDNTVMTSALEFTGGIVESGNVSTSFTNVLTTSTISLSHGMSAIPEFCQCIAKCTSPDGIFITGDKIFIPPVTRGGYYGFNISFTSSQVKVKGIRNTYQMIEHSTGQKFTIQSGVNSSKWALDINVFR